MYPTHDYAKLTVDPATLDVPPISSTQPIKPRFASFAEPTVASPEPATGEPLVPVEHPRLKVLSAYFYAKWPQARQGAWLRRYVAGRLYVAAESLPDGFGLAVFDAWRPLELQTALYESAYAEPNLPAGYVAPPSTNPAIPSPHLTGGAVDLTLTWAGTPLRLGTDFDEFTAAAHPAAFESTPGQLRDLRRLLLHTMEDVGFVRDVREWWHFEYGTRRWGACTGATPRYGPIHLDPA